MAFEWRTGDTKNRLFSLYYSLFAQENRLYGSLHVARLLRTLWPFEPLRITEHQEHCVGLPPEVIATLYLLDGAVEDAERLYCKPQHRHGWLDVQASRLAQQLCIASAEDVASLTQLALQLVSLYEDDDYPRGLEMIPTGHYPCWGITNCSP
ncbi:hypothetical protein BDW60DRAFT_183067 [Aspergillus nidulans var. acristatus]